MLDAGTVLLYVMPPALYKPAVRQNRAMEPADREKWEGMLEKGPITLESLSWLLGVPAPSLTLQVHRCPMGHPLVSLSSSFLRMLTGVGFLIVQTRALTMDPSSISAMAPSSLTP